MRLVTVTPNPSIDRLYEVDRFVRDAVNRPVTETLVAGGKGFNVARAAIALGAEVRSVALLAGHAGRWMADRLAEERILGRWTWTDGETRSLFRDPRGPRRDAYRVNKAGPLVGPATWSDLVTAFSAELTGGGVGVATLSGSLRPAPRSTGSGSSRRSARRSVSRSRSTPEARCCGWPSTPGHGSSRSMRRRRVRPSTTRRGAATTGRRTRSTTRRGRSPRPGARGTDRWGGDRHPGPRRRDRDRTDGQTYGVGRPDPEGSYPVGSGDAFLAGVTVATMRVVALRGAPAGAAAAIANAQVRGAGRLERTRSLGSVPGSWSSRSPAAQSGARSASPATGSQAAGRPSAPGPDRRSPSTTVRARPGRPARRCPGSTTRSRAGGCDSRDGGERGPRPSGRPRRHGRPTRMWLRATSPSASSRSIRRVTPLRLRTTPSASWFIAPRDRVPPRAGAARRTRPGNHLLGPEVVVESAADERVGGQERAPGPEPGSRGSVGALVGTDILVGRLAHGQHHTRCRFG